jgi:catechol 2,3-dioxygenase-like lactoylglutathione lyase family enzyme
MMERPINQIALSVSNLPESMAWYAALGLEANGGAGPRSGSHYAALWRVPELEGRMEWLVGRNPMSQLELFHFTRPTPRPLRADRSALDEGYGHLGLFIAKFEEQLARFSADGHHPEITGPVGSRSLWVRDPDGIIVELMERDALGAEPVLADGAHLPGIRTISLTVSDLAQAEDFWTSAFGFSRVPEGAYTPNPFPSLWSGGVQWRESVLKGGSILVRLLAPASGAIIPRPDDYLLTDIGIVNIAAISDSFAAHQQFMDTLHARGFEFAMDEPLSPGPERAVAYGYDPQGNSFETGYLLPGLETQFGWRR